MGHKLGALEPTFKSKLHNVQLLIGAVMGLRGTF